MTLSKDDIFQEVGSALNRLFDVPIEQINVGTSLNDDLGLDSIDAVDLIVELQKQTKRKITPERFWAIRTVGDIVDVVADVLQESK